MDNQEKLAAQGTQNEEKKTLDTTIRKQTKIT